MASTDLPIEQVMGKLQIDPSRKPNHQDTNGRSPSAATGSIGESEIDYEPPVVPYSPNNYYGYSYYYPGFDGSESFSGVVDNQGYYANGGEGLEVQYPVMVADDGSLVYFMPGYQPGYDPYTSYLPMATTGVDGHYVAQQPYTLSPAFSPSISSPCYYPTHVPYGSELVPSYYMADTSHLVGDGAYANGYTTAFDKQSSKPASGHTHAPSKPNSEFRNNGSWNQLKGSTKPKQHGTNVQPDSVKTKAGLPLTNLPSYHESKGGIVYPNNTANLKANEWGSNVNESTKIRSKNNGFSGTTLLNVQSNGPKATKVEAEVCKDPTKNGKNKSDDITSPSGIQRGQFNLPDFPTKYNNAFFFVIKSYSEDDIHKSIKYSVWASTPNGNKKLDSAYQEAQAKPKENASKCPVFLFFSVNASGQFCGVAEMTGRVDFNKSMDFWQQDKWNGYFPVKWHIIKDIPNPQLRHIILENNENKPVTNSRDTQEVRFPQGIEMLGIFKNYVSKTSILDDFEFYESRQKVMQQKRIAPSALRYDVLQPKVDEWSRVEVKASD